MARETFSEVPSWRPCSNTQMFCLSMHVEYAHYEGNTCAAAAYVQQLWSSQSTPMTTISRESLTYDHIDHVKTTMIFWWLHALSEFHHSKLAGLLTRFSCNLHHVHLTYQGLETQSAQTQQFLPSRPVTWGVCHCSILHMPACSTNLQ